MEENRKYVNPTRAMQILGVGRTTLYKFIAQGKLVSRYAANGRRWFLLDSVESLAKARPGVDSAGLGKNRAKESWTKNPDEVFLRMSRNQLARPSPEQIRVLYGVKKLREALED